MHFEYNDGYGGTTDSNKGLVSVEYTPYADYLNLARELPHEPLPAGLLLRHGALIPVPSANACAGPGIPQPDTRDSG